MHENLIGLFACETVPADSLIRLGLNRGLPSSSLMRILEWCGGNSETFLNATRDN